MQQNLLLGKTYGMLDVLFLVVLPEYAVPSNRGLRYLKILCRIASLIHLVDLFASYFIGKRVNDCSFFCSSSELGYNQDLIECMRVVQVNLEVMKPKIKNKY